MAAPGKVIKIPAIRVSLSLKADIFVSTIPVAVLYQPEQPFQQIQQIERNKQQFTLLSGVDALMVYQVTVNPQFIARPNRAKYIDTKPLRNKRTLYNYWTIGDFIHFLRVAVSKIRDYF